MTATIVKPCGFTGCDRPARGSGPLADGLCAQHQAQRRKGQALAPLAEYRRNSGQCAGPGCDRRARLRGLCSPHYEQQRRGHELAPLRTSPGVETECRFPGCGRLVKSLGLCSTHYAQERRGVELTPVGSTRGGRRSTESRAPRQRPARAERAPKVTPTPARPGATAFPAGWDKPSKPRRQTVAVQSGPEFVTAMIPGPWPENTPAERAGALAYLTRTRALDLADMLGLTQETR